MSKPKFCCTCINWERVVPQIGGDNFGICDSVEVAMKVALDGKTDVQDEGTLWTESYFGCIHWRENDGSLVSTDDIVEDEIAEFQSNVVDVTNCRYCNKPNQITNEYCVWCKMQL